MRTLFVFGICLALLAFPGPAGGENALSNLFEAVVKVSATIPGDARTAESLGAEREGNGVVIDNDGLVLTIGYLILEADTIHVVMPGGGKVPAQLVAYDHDTGFGLLRTTRPLAVTPMQLGESSGLEAGHQAVVMSAGGEEEALAARVMLRGVFVGYWEYVLENAIYTFPAHPNFAGAALVGADGRLLGIGSIFTRLTVLDFASVPCNMFVPIDLLKPILQNLIRLGHSGLPQRPWLGLHLREIMGRLIVQSVSADGPAAKSGLKSGDVILKVEKAPVNGVRDFLRKVWALGEAGVEVRLEVLQGNDLRQVTVISASRHDYLKIRPVRGIAGDRHSFF